MMVKRYWRMSSVHRSFASLVMTDYCVHRQLLHHNIDYKTTVKINYVIEKKVYSLGRLPDVRAIKYLTFERTFWVMLTIEMV
jgi:hypothetical protein